MKSISTTFMIRLALRGNVLIRFFSILLSAIAYALFSIASMGFTTNLTDLNVKGILNYYAPCLSIVYKHRTQNGTSTEIGQENIDLFEKISPVSYLYDGYWGLTSLFDYTTNPESVDVQSYVNRPSVLCASESLLHNVGYTLLVGNYPNTVHEIALSENQLDLFKQYGYTNAVDRLKWNEKKQIYEFDKKNSFGIVEKITSANDLLGKKMTMWGDLEKGMLSCASTGGNAFFEVTIVGIVDTHTEEIKRAYEDEKIIPTSCIFVSDEWRQNFIGKKDELCNRLYLEKPNDYATAFKLTNALETMQKNAEKNGEYTEAGLYLFLPSEYFSEFTVGKTILTAISILFLLFSFLLEVRMTQDSIDLKRRKIGILRSLGADCKTVVKILAVELVVVAVSSILLSLAFSITLNELLLKPFFTMERYGIVLFGYKAINVAILLLIGMIFPILSSYRTIQKFLQESIVENIVKSKREGGIGHVAGKTNR